MQRINLSICLLVLAATIGGSACSFGRINAQNPNAEAARRETGKPVQSPTPAYKEPKRVSKDVISAPEKPKKSKAK